MAKSVLAQTRWVRVVSGFVTLEIVRTINLYLVLTAAGLGLLFAWKFFSSPITDFSRITDEQRAAADAETVFTIPEPADLSFYEDQVAGETIFKASSEPAVPVDTNPGKENPINDFVLVGLLPGDKPQAILENTKKQQTYYLTQGQSEDSVLVEEITGDSVVIAGGGSKKRLSL